MSHLCERCCEINISDEAVASIKTRLKVEDVVHTLSEPHVPGIEYLRSSIRCVSGKRSCHLCALVLHSLKDPRNIGTSEEDSGFPDGPISLDIHFQGDEMSLIPRSGETLGNPLVMSAGSDESCRGADVSTDSDSDEVFQKVLSWCNDCSAQHKHCSRMNNEETWLPSRVIDVGPPDGQSKPRLCDTRGYTGRYITLTHRWNVLTERSGTTRSNFESRKFSINVNELSKTFQDAIEVTRKLRIQYLWIDALCILQDSQEDWITEAKNMASIYELAWLNIACAGSEEMDGRIFMKRDWRLCRPCRMPHNLSRLSQIQSKGMGEDTYAYLRSEFNLYSIFAGFLNRRGWILQERLLSPRTIYYGKDEIYWECNHMIASETVPWGWTNHSLMAKINSYSDPPKRKGDTISAKTLEHTGQDLSNPEAKFKRLNIALQPTDLAPLYEYWYKIIEVYSQKKLTVATDKLPAIHGIARALHRSRMAHRVFEECYHNGIWINDLTRQLLWIGEPWESSTDYSVTSTFRMFTDGVPTYTWASCRNSVRFLLTHPPRFENIKNIHPLLEERDIHPWWPDKVYSGNITLSELITKIPKGSLGLEGQLEHGTLHKDALELIDQSVFINGLLTFESDRSLTATTILDASCTTKETLRWLNKSSGAVWCLEVATADKASLSEDIKWPTTSSNKAHSASTTKYTLGLILVPTPEFLIFLEKSPVRHRLKLKWPGPWSVPRSGLWNYMHLPITPVSFRRIGLYISRQHLSSSDPPTTIFLA